MDYSHHSRHERLTPVPAIADSAEALRSLVAKLGIASGMTVQEIGDDDDVDDQFRSAVDVLDASALPRMTIRSSAAIEDFGVAIGGTSADHWGSHSTRHSSN